MIVVLGSLLIGVAGYIASTRGIRSASVALHTTSPTPAQPSPVPAAGRSSLALWDVAVVSPTSGWALLSNCTQPQSKCQYLVSATRDGGQTWTRPVQVGPDVDSSYDGPRNITSLDSANGFVYGHQNAYATHDGGQTWHDLRFPAFSYSAMAAAAGEVWVVSSPCDKGISCRLEVRWSTDGGNTWSLHPHLLPAGFYPESIVAFDSGLVMSSVPNGDLEMTDDRGVTWTSQRSQCPGNPFRARVATASGSEVWELCLGYPNADAGTATKNLYVSEDWGKSWSKRASSEGGGILPATGSLPYLYSNRAGRGFLVGGQAALVTRDAGSTWTPLALRAIPLNMLRFSGADVGWAVSGAGIWSTIDGGDHWTAAGTLPR